MKLITVEASFGSSDLDAAITLFSDQADTVRAMPGRSHYVLYRKPSADGIAILQHWETMAQFDAYRASDTFGALVTGLRPLMAGPPVTIVAEVDTDLRMTTELPSAYCYFQNLEPRPTLDAVFERDYLLYAVSGALRVTVGDESWLLPPSFAAWVPAGTQMLVDIGKPATTCTVLVNAGFCNAMPTAPTVFQMSSMTRQMIRYCKDWGADAQHPPEAEGFFLSLLNVCAGLVSKSVDVKRPVATDPAMQHAIEITEARVASKITASEVARAAHLSERSMQRRFAEDVRMTWSEVLTGLRMIRAVELLSDDSLTIIQIAGESGFNSLSAFNRAFLTFAQSTPSEFRKALRVT